MNLVEIFWVCNCLSSVCLKYLIVSCVWLFYGVRVLVIGLINGILIDLK